jgi:hypothetical protein
MKEAAQRYPHYGWERNAGYGTAQHLAALRAHGPTRSIAAVSRRLRNWCCSRLDPWSFATLRNPARLAMQGPKINSPQLAYHILSHVLCDRLKIWFWPPSVPLLIGRDSWSQHESRLDLRVAMIQIQPRRRQEGTMMVTAVKTRKRTLKAKAPVKTRAAILPPSMIFPRTPCPSTRS